VRRPFPLWHFLLQFAEPPHPSEVAIRKRFEKIGIGSDKPWDASKVDPATLAAIDAGVKQGQAEIDALAAKTFSTNGLFGSRAQLKTNYLQRDVGAMKGVIVGNSKCTLGCALSQCSFFLWVLRLSRIT
jgi:hypothetical protein